MSEHPGRVEAFRIVAIWCVRAAIVCAVPAASFAAGICGTYLAPANYAVGTAPRAVATDDFNHDTFADLITANASGNSFSILTGTGTGTFNAASTIAITNGTGADFIATRDVNKDGNPDLAIANGTSNNLSIYLGVGNGTFSSAGAYTVGTNPSAVTFADFDKDGNIDIAVANHDSNNISFLLGNGDGSFVNAVNIATVSGPASLAAADLNGDNKADLVLASQSSNTVTILLGNGNGTFAAPVNLNVGTGPDFVAIADLNHDNKLDLIVANSTSNNVSILLGNGDGTFQNATGFATGTQPSSIAIGDFNVDGNPDLAVSNKGSLSVSLLLGGGDGSFGTAIPVTTGNQPSSIVAINTNGDANLDLATANTAGNNVSVLINTCPASDLTIAKTHAGNFRQGDTGKTFTITVSNTNAPGIVATAGTVTVSDPMPPGLTATGLTGTGWQCGTTPPQCSRSDALAPGSSYPPITVTVDVAADAQSATNTATVSGGGEINTANDSGSNAYTVVPVADLTITQAHAGSLYRGRTGVPYTLTVANIGPGPTVGTVSVTDTLPSGLSATAISGTGWTSCTLTPPVGCSRSDVLASGGLYPPITMTVNVASNAPLSVTNTAVVSGGGELNLANDTSTDRSNVALTQQSPCPDFAPAVSYNTGTSPAAVAIGDFNRDRMPDAAIPNSGANNVTILPGAANGTLGTASTVNAGTDPRWVAIGDFNRNGKQDLAVANFASNDVSILFGLTGVSFAVPSSLPAGTGPVFVATADFNRDGSPDLAVVNATSNNITILLGNGAGAFLAGVNYAVGNNPRSLAIGDFNRDGKLDLVVANNGSSNFSLLTGTGTGTFNNAVNFAAGTNPVSIVAADFNRNGKLDVAVVNNGANNVMLRFGDGGGGFTNGPTIAFTGGLFATVADVNSDGAPDLVLAAAASNSLTVLLNNGAGTFGAPIPFGAGTAPVSMATADLNLDSKPDFIAINQSTNVASVLLNAGVCSLNCGQFPTEVNFAAGTMPQGVAIDDFDGDGRLDVAVANSASGNMSVLLATGDGTFAAPANYTAGTTPNAIVSGDFTGDGKPDLVVANKDTTDISVFLNTGNGTFSTLPTFFASIFPYAMAAGDFNRDGKLDLAVAMQATNQVRVFPGVGDGTFGTSVAIFTGTNSGPQSIAAGDFNRDGKLDLVTGNYGTANVLVLLGDGTGGFAAASNIPFTPGFPQTVVAGDFNRDGILDLAVGNAFDHMWVMIGNGAGDFAAPVSNGSNRPYSAAAAADFNGDGIADLTGTGGNLTQIAILFGNATGGFGTDVYYSAGPGSYAAPIATGDFNRDGKPDIATGNFLTADVAILPNTCPAPDVTITNVHNGAFVRGQTGTYTLHVTNSGNSPTTAAVVLTDSLATGITATGLSGTGWTCDLPSLTCSRSDVLNGGQSYPDITLTVSIATDVATSAANVVLVAGGGEINDTNNTATDNVSIPLLSTTTSVTALPNPTVFGQSVTFTAIVTGSGPTPAGSVTFSDGPNMLQVVPLDGTAHAALTTNALGPGKHNITASYGGNATYDVSTSPIVVQEVDQSATTTALLSSLNPAFTGQSVSFTATVTPVAPGSGSPTGTVTFMDGVATLGSSSVNNAGQATFTTLTLNGGSHSVTAVYGGDGNFTGSTSTAVVQAMNFAAPTNVIATANASGSEVNVTWNTVPRAASYDVYRSSHHAGYAYAGSSPAAGYIDSNVDPNTTYLYEVRAADGPALGPFSTFDFATTVAFTDDPIVAGQTLLTAAHLQELHAAVNAMESAGGRPLSTFSDIAPGTSVRAIHIIELRFALNAARTALVVPALTYTDPAMWVDTPIVAAHIQELREGVK